MKIISLIEKYNLPIYVCMPNNKPKAIIYFAHGITEYGLRHKDFFKYLCDKGYAVITNDIFSDEKNYKDWDKVCQNCIESFYFVQHEISYDYIPIYGIGFSFGSYVIQSISNTIHFDKVVLVGSGETNIINLKVGKFIAKNLMKMKNKNKANALIKKIFFSQYNKHFEHETDFDWLVANKEALNEYLNDDKCDKVITPIIMNTLLEGMIETYGVTPKHSMKNTFVLILSGFNDPVGGGKNIARLANSFDKAGVHYYMDLYDGRHDILKDNCKQEVFEDIVNYIEE